MNQNFGAELDSSMMLDSNMLLDSYMILDSSMIVETDSNMILDSSMMVETDSLNDEWEESDGESLANEMKVINRPLSKQFRNSKYNKKTYPSGFKVNVSRHEQFLHSAQNANGKNRSDGDEGQETHRTNFSQLSNEKIAECSKPKTSFMFWAQGNPHRTDVDHHKMPISDATTAPPYSAGGWQKKSRSHMSGIKPTTPINSGLREYTQEEANSWLDQQITTIHDTEVSHQLDADSSDVFIGAPQFNPQTPKISRPASRNTRNISKELLELGDLDASSSHQLPFIQLERDINSPSSVSRKKQVNTPYTGFRAYNVKGTELKEFISFDNWSSKNLERSLSDEKERDIEIKNKANGLQPSIRIRSSLVVSDSVITESVGNTSMDVMDASEFLKNSVTQSNITNGYQENNVTQLGINNMVPLGTRLILMIYHYKAMRNSKSHSVFEKPALILDVISTVEYTVIMKIMSDFLFSSEASSKSPTLQSTQSLKPKTLSLNKNSNRNAIVNPESNDSGTDKKSSLVEIHYFHIILKVWRLIENETGWSSAILLSLENSEPMKLMITKNKEKDSQELYLFSNPKGMSSDHLRLLTKSIGDSKLLMSLGSQTETDRKKALHTIGQNSISNPNILTSYNLMEAQKEKSNTLLKRNSLLIKTDIPNKNSPFIVQEKPRFTNPVDSIQRRKTQINEIFATAKNESKRGSSFLPPKYKVRTSRQFSRPNSRPNSSLPSVGSSSLYRPPSAGLLFSESTTRAYSNSMVLDLAPSLDLDSPRSIIKSGKVIPKAEKQAELVESLESALLQTRW